MTLAFVELGAGIISFILGGIVNYYGGVFSFIMLGLNILVMAAVGTFMYLLTNNCPVFVAMWAISYEFYSDYAGVLFALIGGIIAATAKPPKPVDD